MKTNDVVIEYQAAYRDLYGQEIAVTLHGSWWQVGSSFSFHRTSDLRKMAAELRRRKAHPEEHWLR